MQTERRQLPRVKINLPLRYKIRRRREFGNAVCDDISVGGLAFINNEFIAPQTPLALELNIFSGVLTPLGKIASATHLAHSDRYRIGVEFSNIDNKDKDSISDYMFLKSL